MSSTRNITLDLLRVIGMFFVMFIHSPGNADMQTAPEIFLLKGFISSGAVPVFFLLSGYFGARKIDLKSVSPGHYIQEKIHTLIIPFLFWNSAVLVLVFTVKYFHMDSAFRGSGAYFDVSPNASSIGAALFGIGRCPIVYQFWFFARFDSSRISGVCALPLFSNNTAFTMAFFAYSFAYRAISWLLHARAPVAFLAATRKVSFVSFEHYILRMLVSNGYRHNSRNDYNSVSIARNWECGLYFYDCDHRFNNGVRRAFFSSRANSIFCLCDT